MKHVRRGVFLMEAIAAGALLAVMVALVLHAMSTTAIERRRMEHRAVALQEIAGVMERVAAMPAQEISPERLNGIQLSPSIDKLLPRPQLAWSITPDGSLPGGQHVRAVLTWQELRDSRPASVHLDYWAFAPPTLAQEAP